MGFPEATMVQGHFSFYTVEGSHALARKNTFMIPHIFGVEVDLVVGGPRVERSRMSDWRGGTPFAPTRKDITFF